MKSILKKEIEPTLAYVVAKRHDLTTIVVLPIRSNLYLVFVRKRESDMFHYHINSELLWCLTVNYYGANSMHY